MQTRATINKGTHVREEKLRENYEHVLYDHPTADILVYDSLPRTADHDTNHLAYPSTNRGSISERVNKPSMATTALSGGHLLSA